MRNLLNPKWIFVINTTPIAVLFLIYIRQYSIIESLLAEENIILWRNFGFALALLGTANFLYAFFLVLKRRKVSHWYGVVALSAYIPFLYLYSNYHRQIVPASIPQWMVAGDLMIYTGTFLMPTLAYSLFILVAHFTSTEKHHKAWVNFLLAIAVPVAWYLFTQLVLPFWKPVDSDFSLHAVVIFIIVGTVVFLFFLARAVYILTLKKNKEWREYRLVWKIVVSIILPVSGLVVNNDILGNEFGGVDSGVFGNFNSTWFYVLAVLNGIFICLPHSKDKLFRLLLFIGRSFTFSFTLYFFLVFLPYLPLSVIAIVVFGAGFLMLAPLALFIVHVSDLASDFRFLTSYLPKKWISIIAFSSFLGVPVSITATYLYNKSVLNEALSYLYAPDYSKKYELDRDALARTINMIKKHKDTNRAFFLNGRQLPYLSSYFNWLVLDNLTLSDDKINNIERVFFGRPALDPRPENLRDNGVEISWINSKSIYDSEQKAWKSQVDLEIANNSEDRLFSEYATTFELPDGCWISDYYLFVGERKEMGILAEKKSAMWIFSQIRNTNRDPGILYYLTGNRVAFRIFPFLECEVRKTGIEFIHKEPITLNIDGHSLELGNTLQQFDVQSSTDKNVIYVSAGEKSSLTRVRRKPYYHFIVDASREKEKFKEQFAEKIDRLLRKDIISQDKAKISFVNTYVSTFEFNDRWEDMYAEQTFEGGFYLDRAIKTILFNSYKSRDGSYPVIVIVTDSIKNAVVEKDFADFKIAYPESDLFFDLDELGELKAHSLSSKPAQPLTEISAMNLDRSVLAYPNAANPTAYLPDDGKPSVVLKNDLFGIADVNVSEKKWESALTMQGSWISQVFHPETSEKEWLRLVKASFMSKVMTPVTSYIAVENEAQKAMLKRKQEQVLSGNKSLDLSDDVQQMSEPGLVLLAILMVLFLLSKRKRKLRWTQAVDSAEHCDKQNT